MAGRDGGNEGLVTARDAKKLVLPWQPVFDKIAAAFMVAAIQGVSDLANMIIELQENQHPAASTLRRWVAEMALVIDVGREKYQLNGKGSACSVLASREHVEGLLAKLAHIADKNNKTGYLKGYNHSVVWILREMYKLGYSKMDVVQAVGHAIRMWIQAQEPSVRKKNADRTKESFLSEAELAELRKEVGDDFRDFTLAQYALNIWLCGYSVTKIKERVEYFLEAERKARETEAGLEEVFEESRWLEFAENQGILLETDNERLGRWIIKNRNWKVVIIRHPARKNVVILTRGEIDLSLLATVLILLEGHAQKDQEHGRWYYDDRINAILNGTVGHHVPATQLTNDQLIELVDLLVLGFRRYQGQAINDLADRLIGTVRKRQIERRLVRWTLAKTLSPRMKDTILDGEQVKLRPAKSQGKRRENAGKH